MGESDPDCGFHAQRVWEAWREPSSLATQTVQNLPATQETWVRSLGREDSLEKAWHPTPVFLPGEFHGQRRLVVGYSPWGLKESDTVRESMHVHMCISISIYIYKYVCVCVYIYLYL